MHPFFTRIFHCSPCRNLSDFSRAILIFCGFTVHFEHISVLPQHMPLCHIQFSLSLSRDKATHNLSAFRLRFARRLLPPGRPLRVRQPVQHRHLASVPRNESPTRVAHHRRKVAGAREAALRLMQRAGHAAEVERDARAARMVGE